jgi:hypothetical protein
MNEANMEKESQSISPQTPEKKRPGKLKKKILKGAAAAGLIASMGFGGMGQASAQEGTPPPTTETQEGGPAETEDGLEMSQEQEGETEQEFTQIPETLLSLTPSEISDNFEFDYQKLGWVRETEDGQTEVWRPMMTEDNVDVEAGWLREMDRFHDETTNSTVILEMNPDKMSNRDEAFGRGYDSIQLTEAFRENYGRWIEEHEDKIGGLRDRTIYIQLVPEYSAGQVDEFLYTYVSWEDSATKKPAYSFRGLALGNQTVFMRTYTLGGWDWFPGQEADENIISEALLHALAYASAPVSELRWTGSGTTGRAITPIIDRHLNLEVYEGLRPNHFPNVPLEQETKLVQLGE